GTNRDGAAGTSVILQGRGRKGTIPLNVQPAAADSRFRGRPGFFSFALRVTAGAGIRVADFWRRRRRTEGAGSVHPAQSDVEFAGLYRGLQHRLRDAGSDFDGNWAVGGAIQGTASAGGGRPYYCVWLAPDRNHAYQGALFR